MRNFSPATDKTMTAGKASRMGFHGTGIADNCAEAGGISPGRLYHYFPSKQAIIEALVAAERREVVTLFIVASSADDPMDGLDAFLERAVKASNEPAYAAVACEVIGESSRNPEIARIVDYAERDYRERIIAFLDGVRRHRLARCETAWPAKEDDRLARARTLLLDGAMVRGVLEPSARPMLTREVADLARQTIAAACR